MKSDLELQIISEDGHKCHKFHLLEVTLGVPSGRRETPWGDETDPFFSRGVREVAMIPGLSLRPRPLVVSVFHDETESCQATGKTQALGHPHVLLAKTAQMSVGMEGFFALYWCPETPISIHWCWALQSGRLRGHNNA